MSDNIYVGNGKAKETQYGTFYALSFSNKDLDTMKEHLNEKGYINLNMSKRKTPGKYGETHSIIINDWKPEGKTQKKEVDDDLFCPF